MLTPAFVHACCADLSRFDVFSEYDTGTETLVGLACLGAILATDLVISYQYVKDTSMGTEDVAEMFTVSRTALSSVAVYVLIFGNITYQWLASFEVFRGKGTFEDYKESLGYARGGGTTTDASRFTHASAEPSFSAQASKRESRQEQSGGGTMPPVGAAVPPVGAMVPPIAAAPPPMIIASTSFEVSSSARDSVADALDELDDTGKSWRMQALAHWHADVATAVLPTLRWRLLWPKSVSSSLVRAQRCSSASSNISQANPYRGRRARCPSA